jgi:hypothetical protein
MMRWRGVLIPDPEVIEVAPQILPQITQISQIGNFIKQD